MATQRKSKQKLWLWIVLTVVTAGVVLGVAAVARGNTTKFEPSQLAKAATKSRNENDAADQIETAKRKLEISQIRTADITTNYVQSLATAGIKPSNVTINTTSSYVWPGKTPDGATCSIKW